MKKALVIGGGFGGCTSVYQLKKKGWHVTLVNPTRELGGGVRTRFFSGHPVTYGPRHFLTHNQQVYDYLQGHIELRRCQEHKFLSYVNNDCQFYSYPIHEDDIPRMPEASRILEELTSIDPSFRDAQYKLTTGNASTQQRAVDYEDFWQKSIGNTLYEKFIKTYTHKMWMISDNTAIDDFSWSPKGVAIKRGPREGWDTAISAYPTAIDGYNKFFDSASQLVDVFIMGSVKKVDPGTLTVHLPHGAETFDLIINSAPVDDVYNMFHGPLCYIGRHIEYVVLPVEYALPPSVYFTYYTGQEPYTRVVEYKKFTRYMSPYTVISLEYPSSSSGKYYPLPVPDQRDLHRAYESLNHSMFFNIGRIAKYNYRYDIDDVIEQVLALSDDVL